MKSLEFPILLSFSIIAGMGLAWDIFGLCRNDQQIICQGMVVADAAYIGIIALSLRAEYTSGGEGV